MFNKLLYTIDQDNFLSTYFYIGTYLYLIIISIIVLLVNHLVLLILRENSKKTYKYWTVYLKTFMVFSLMFCILHGISYRRTLYYSFDRIEKTFNDNIYLFDDFAKYAKNGFKKEEINRIISFRIVNKKVWYRVVTKNETWYFGELEDKGEILNDEYLTNLFLELNKKCDIDIFAIYKNNDVGLYITNGGFDIEYTDDKKTLELLEKDFFYIKLNDGWYGKLSYYEIDRLTRFDSPQIDVEIWDKIQNR